MGWEELSNGVIVAGQPDGAPSWSPCHDSPADKAAYRFTVTAEAGYEVVANGRLVTRTPRAGRVRWEYEQPEPMAPYLATLQVGRYLRIATGPREEALVPARLRHAAAYDLGRQTEMITLFEDCSGPTRSRPTPWWSPTTTWRSRSRRRACRSSAPTTWTADEGPNGSSRTSWRTSGSATA